MARTPVVSEPTTSDFTDGVARRPARRAKPNPPPKAAAPTIPLWLQQVADSAERMNPEALPLIRDTPLATIAALLLEPDAKCDAGWGDASGDVRLTGLTSALLLWCAFRALRLEQVDPAVLAESRRVKDEIAKLQEKLLQVNEALPTEARRGY